MPEEHIDFSMYWLTFLGHKANLAMDKMEWNSEIYNSLQLSAGHVALLSFATVSA